MEQTYSYRGFDIAVDVMPVTENDADDDQSGELLGYMAAVALGTHLGTGQWSTTFSAGAPSGRLFRKASEVFWGGYEAATAIIDEAIRAMGGTLTPAQLVPCLSPCVS